MKKLLSCLAFVLISTWCIYEINGNFSVDNITLVEWPESSRKNLNSPAELLRAKSILEQSFTYLGQGRQSFIFESADGKYVLKFIKCQRINPAKWYEIFADNSSEKLARFARLSQSMILAKNPLQEQTGVLFLHIQPDSELRQVQLFDRLGFCHTVDIDQCPYVLQRKAQPAFSTLKALYKENKKEEVQTRLNQLLDLFVERASLGITNPDGKLIGHDNVGFLQDRAVYIDIGTLRRSAKSKSASYLVKDFKRLDPILEWLQSVDENLAMSFSVGISDAKKKILASDQIESSCMQAY